MNEKALLEFVGPYYAKKDAMHDLSHIRRLLNEALSISRKYHADKETLACAAYFHGIEVGRHRDELMKFLTSQGSPKREAAKILRVASESLRGSNPKTIEGKILHDAHLVMGGRTLMVTRFLVTGALRGFPVEHTIDYFEEDVYRKFRCYLPETARKYFEMEEFAHEFFRDLRKSFTSSEKKIRRTG